MILDFSTAYMIFRLEIAENGQICVKEFRSTAAKADAREIKNTPIAELQLSGRNPAESHFAKHSGSSESHTLRYVSHSETSFSKGREVRVLQRNDLLEVISVYRIYGEFSALQAFTEVKNIADEPVGLEYVSSFSFMGLDGGISPLNEQLQILLPHNSWEREVDWQAYSPSQLGYERNSAFAGKRICLSNTGTFSTKEFLPMGAVINKELHNAYLFQIEHNGSWTWEISDRDKSLYLRLSGPTEQESHWYKELAPGETFLSVPAAVCVGENFEESLAAMTKYRMEIAPLRPAEEHLPVIFNDYLNCLWANPTEEKELPVIARAAQAGAEYYVMDAGWYAEGAWWDFVGEWQPSPVRFPNGIKAVFDKVKEYGMIPGIWLEIEVMGIQCPLAKKLPDDWFFVRHGKRVIDNGRYMLDFRNPDVRKFATAVIDRVVGEYGVGYIKFDYNIDAGIGTERDADSFGDGLLKHCRAYIDWIAEIKKKYPLLVTENCSSGGMRMDYAMLRMHDMQSMSDQDNGIFNTRIAAAAATAVLPRQAGIWAAPKARYDETRIALCITNALLGRMHLSGAVTEMSDKAFALVKEGVAVYKSIRENIKEALPFYPIGLPRYDGGWMVAGLKTPTVKYLTVWRMEGEEESIKIPLTGKAKILYPASLGYAEVQNGKDGIAVTVKEKNAAVLLEIR